VKNPRDILKESPFSIAALLSLSGVGVVVSSQWGTTFAAQKTFVDKFWPSFTRKKESLVDAVASSLYCEQQQTLSKVPSKTKIDNKSPASEPLPPLWVKKWLRTGRIIYGISNMSYNDA